MRTMPTLHSHTHCQVAPANAATKALAKSLQGQPREKEILNNAPTHNKRKWKLQLQIERQTTTDKII
jgi:hypothetical protein